MTRLHPRETTNDPRVVAVVVSHGLLTFDFAIACEVFGLDRSDIAEPWYDFRVVSSDEPPLRTSTGFTIGDVQGLDAARDAGTIIVPGWSDPDREPDDATRSLLVDKHRDGARIVSFCTGSFALASAGLLDGRRATTHWMYADRLSARYPSIELDPSVLFVDDGGVFTAAGTSAGIDLSLHLVALDHGQAVANAVARRIVMPPLRTGGQAQYIEYRFPESSDPITNLLAWIEEHVADTITVDDLAQEAHVSARSLTRRFSEEVGMPPMTWIANRRLVRARELLETTSLPVDQVASEAGFPSAAAMRSRFRSLFMTTPSEYRLSFRA